MTLFALALQMAQNQPDATGSSLLMFGCVLFAICLLIYVFMPPASVEAGEEKTRYSFLLERKEVIYENLRDLTFEYKAGKLSDDDYRTMRASMEEEAASVLAEIDAIDRAQSGVASRA